MGAAAGSAAWLVYGTLVEANRLVVEHRTLRLLGWPERLNGFKIALLADFHLRDAYSMDLAHRAVALALDEEPDFVVLAGDLVGYWKESSLEMLMAVLEPLLLMEGAVVAVPGNHDYWAGDAAWLGPVLEALNVRFLRNESWSRSGVCWIGVDSLNAGRADLGAALENVSERHEPRIVIWHEPDAVELLPISAHLMLAGHSHGGQWVFPGGLQPMSTRNGRKYVRGFYPDAPTPLYVTRGIGTTGPPARFGALPEVSILSLLSDG